MINLSELIAMLKNIEDHTDAAPLLMINGEYVQEISVELQTPVAEVIETSGMINMQRNKRQPYICSISVNGREHENLPRTRIDLREW